MIRINNMVCQGSRPTVEPYLLLTSRYTSGPNARAVVATRNIVNYFTYIVVFNVNCL